MVDIDPRFPPTEDPSRPGRPKLGVVAREVTLLPRHWDWLATQPGGASVALRKLVEEARRDPKAKIRAARDSLYRFSAALVGNAPGFEEAIRALYAGEKDEFLAHIEAWPEDVRAKLEEMASGQLFRADAPRNPKQCPSSPSRHSGWVRGLWGRSFSRRQRMEFFPGTAGIGFSLGALTSFPDTGFHGFRR